MPGSFNKELEKELKDITDQINTELMNGILYGWNLVTAGTPVDTGRARASWFVSVDVLPVNSKPKAKGGGRVYPDPPPPDFTFDIRSQRHLYIVNNVNYIEFLEYGTPKMEAFGMVQAAVPKINRKLESTFQKIKGAK